MTRIAPGRVIRTILGQRDVGYAIYLGRGRLGYLHSAVFRGEEGAELWAFEKRSVEERAIKKGHKEMELVLVAPMVMQDLNVTPEEKKSLEKMLDDRRL